MTQPAVNWGDPRLPERFWERVSPCPITGCWLWTGLTTSCPQIMIDKKRSSARRMAHDALLSGVPRQKRLLANCGVIECCNPLHAELRTEEQKRKARDIYRARWSQKNAHLRAAYTRKTKYGITPDAAASLIESQGRQCAICAVSFDEPGVEHHLDHCHITGKVRAFLCHRCNCGIGFLRDDPARCRAAADYLEKHGAE